MFKNVRRLYLSIVLLLLRGSSIFVDHIHSSLGICVVDIEDIVHELIFSSSRVIFYLICSILDLIAKIIHGLAHTHISTSSEMRLISIIFISSHLWGLTILSLSLHILDRTRISNHIRREAMGNVFTIGTVFVV